MRYINIHFTHLLNSVTFRWCDAPLPALYAAWSFEDTVSSGPRNGRGSQPRRSGQGERWPCLHVSDCWTDGGPWRCRGTHLLLPPHPSRLQRSLAAVDGRYTRRRNTGRSNIRMSNTGISNTGMSHAGISRHTFSKLLRKILGIFLILGKS